MIKIEKVETHGWEAAIRGLRNPMNSWDKSDSVFCLEMECEKCSAYKICMRIDGDNMPHVGENDLKLMQQLTSAGSDHGKFMRMIVVYMDITAPLYWWAEYDTYKVGTVANSCSKMHKLLHKPFKMSDFSFDKIPHIRIDDVIHAMYTHEPIVNIISDVARPLVDTLNKLRDSYIACEDDVQKKEIWYSILQLLPESYNQKRTVMLNYEVLKNIYHARKNHKLDEWHDFCNMIESLPYSQLITGVEQC